MSICFLIRPSVFVVFAISPYCDIQSVFSLREIFCSGWAMPVCGLPFIFEFFVPLRGCSLFHCFWRSPVGRRATIETTAVLESDCRCRGGLRRRDPFEPQRSCVRARADPR